MCASSHLTQVSGQREHRASLADCCWGPGGGAAHQGDVSLAGQGSVNTLEGKIADRFIVGNKTLQMWERAKLRGCKREKRSVEPRSA